MDRAKARETASTATFIRVRVHSIVHRVFWDAQRNPLGIYAGPVSYGYAFPVCVPYPLKATEIHPTDAPVSCFWCVYRTYLFHL